MCFVPKVEGAFGNSDAFQNDRTLLRVWKQQALPLDRAMMQSPRSQFPEKAVSLVDPFLSRGMKSGSEL